MMDSSATVNIFNPLHIIPHQPLDIVSSSLWNAHNPGVYCRVAPNVQFWCAISAAYLLIQSWPACPLRTHSVVIFFHVSNQLSGHINQHALASTPSLAP
jgi:hypothetical protein